MLLPIRFEQESELVWEVGVGESSGIDDGGELGYSFANEPAWSASGPAGAAGRQWDSVA